jgi:hypothetical protein
MYEKDDVARAYQIIRDASVCNLGITNAEAVAILELCKNELLVDMQKVVDNG